VAAQKFFEKSEKTLRKPIDKLKRLWYNRRVAPRVGVLEASGDRSLTTEQQEKKYKRKSKCEISNFFEEKKLLKSEAYSKKVKRAKNSSTRFQHPEG